MSKRLCLALVAVATVLALSAVGQDEKAGLGLDVKVWKKLSVRGGVRDFWAGQPDFPLAPTGHTRQHNYLVSGGAFWRF